VYDITKASTFQHVSQFRDQITREKEAEGVSVNNDPPLVIVGNKVHLLHRSSENFFS
jgi:hypothetical protein